MENETMSTWALCLALIALVVSVGIGCYLYFEPEIEVDLEEIGNTIDSKVSPIKIKLDGIIDDIKEIDLDDYLKVDDFEDELEDLEEDLEKYCRNRCEDGEDGADGIGLDEVIQCAEEAKLGNYTGIYKDFIDCIIA